VSDVMVDIETLSTRVNAVVLSIGAVAFDPYSDHIGDSFSVQLDPQEQMEKGRHVDVNTIKWWMGQSEEAKKESFSGSNKVEAVLCVFRDFITSLGSHSTLRLWSNGPSFDEAILRSLYADYRVEWPVRYNGGRDCRTLFEIAYPDGPVPLVRGDVVHSAIDDAMWQAMAVQMCMAKLRGGK